MDKGLIAAMIMNSLGQALMDCRQFLPEPFCVAHERLFHREHMQKLADRLCDFHQKGVPGQFFPPSLDVECTPSLNQAFSHFGEFLALWDRATDKSSPQLLQELANTLVATTCQNILVLLGQRLTPASITDARAIPLPKDQLLHSASLIYSAKLTTGARAWTKHVNRNAGDFWGKVQGSEEDKNEAAAKIIQYILDNCTWWNVFWHYKHEIVYEARVPQGYGARWGKDGQEFIGFLEPFTPGFPTIRDFD